MGRSRWGAAPAPLRSLSENSQFLLDVGDGFQKGLLDPFDLNSWFTASTDWWREFQKIRADRSSFSHAEIQKLLAQTDLVLKKQGH